MSDDELRDKINKIAVEIEKIEVTTHQKEAYIKSRIEEDFGPKMGELESQLQSHQGSCDQFSQYCLMYGELFRLHPDHRT